MKVSLVNINKFAVPFLSHQIIYNKAIELLCKQNLVLGKVNILILIKINYMWRA